MLPTTSENAYISVLEPSQACIVLRMNYPCASMDMFVLWHTELDLFWNEVSPSMSKSLFIINKLLTFAIDVNNRRLNNIVKHFCA